MRKALLLFLFLLVIGCLGEPTAPPEGNNGRDSDILNRSPITGDVVEINYIMRVDGGVFDTSYEEIAREAPNRETIEAGRPFGFEPLTFVLGSGHVNPAFSTAVADMKAGDKKTFTLPPEKTLGGLRRDEFVQVMTRFTTIPIEEMMPTPLFKENFGVGAEIGEEVVFEYWNSTVIGVDNETTLLRHAPSEAIVEVLGGNISISSSATNITVEFIPRINHTFRAIDGSFVTILDSNETHMVVDYNHPLAGKTLEVEITLERISQPISWDTALDKAVEKSSENGKPVFLLFTNVSCVTCRRIELEVLTHPSPLALKDDFLWVLADVEIQSELAKKYGAETLPLAIIFKEGREVKRISEFIPPQVMRLEMESALAADN